VNFQRSAALLVHLDSLTFPDTSAISKGEPLGMPWVKPSSQLMTSVIQV
jgi:hypothetical protein